MNSEKVDSLDKVDFDRESDGLRELRESFARVCSGSDLLQCEYTLIREAKLQKIDLDDYRRLLEIYRQQQVSKQKSHKPSLTKQFLHPLYFLERNLETVAVFLKRLAIFEILNYVSKLTIILGVLTYLLGAEERQQQAHNEAWKIINSSKGQATSGGRIAALESLARDKVSLAGLNVENAWLPSVKLKEADLTLANLKNTQLRRAEFTGANLQFADLERADLEGAELEGADLRNANLEDVNLAKANLQNAKLQNVKLQGVVMENANLENADLTGAKLEANLKGTSFKGTTLQGADLTDATNLTVEQIKSANNWQHAQFDPEIRSKL